MSLNDRQVEVSNAFFLLTDDHDVICDDKFKGLSFSHLLQISAKLIFVAHWKERRSVTALKVGNQSEEWGNTLINGLEWCKINAIIVQSLISLAGSDYGSILS